MQNKEKKKKKKQNRLFHQHTALTRLAEHVTAAMETVSVHCAVWFQMSLVLLQISP